jgi:hypothetical protein
MKLGEEEGSLALDRERTRITKLLTDRKIILDLTVLLRIILYFSLTLQRQFRLYIPFLGIARPQPQFPH